MQTAAKEFVDVLPERINLGLVSFAGTATTLVPPTTDRAQVESAIDNLDLAESTAIGEAVFTSLTAIENYQSSLEADEAEEVPARIVLLSDGYNTVGREDTQAIDAARAAGVPVSTIAFGTDYGTLDLDGDRKSTRLNSSHANISYAVFCLKKKKKKHHKESSWLGL